MVKEIEKQVEFDKDESYFKNKFLRFLFNSKENVAEGIQRVFEFPWFLLPHTQSKIKQYCEV